MILPSPFHFGLLRSSAIAAVLVIVPPALAQQAQPRPAPATTAQPTQARPAGTAAPSTQSRPAAGTAQQRPAVGTTQPRPATGAAAQPRPGTTTAPPAQSRSGAAPSGGVAQPQGAGARPAAGAAGAAGAAAASPLGGGAAKVAEHDDWAVYTAQAGRSKICYALTQPKERLPRTVNRDPAYLFVSFRPSESVKNEIALVMGFPTKEDGPAEAVIGSTSYALLTKEANGWLKNAAEEGQAIATMSRGQNLLVKVQSRRGTSLTDRYSLKGFGPALERARKECP